MPMSDRCYLPWSREFDDAIPLPGGRALVTLEDAARYVQKLPKKEQDQPHWQTATLTLINIAEGRDFLFHPNAAITLTRSRPAGGTTPITASLPGR
jgi:hypothetical protein